MRTPGECRAPDELSAPDMQRAPGECHAHTGQHVHLSGGWAARRQARRLDGRWRSLAKLVAAVHSRAKRRCCSHWRTARLLDAPNFVCLPSATPSTDAVFVCGCLAAMLVVLSVALASPA